MEMKVEMKELAVAFCVLRHGQTMHGLPLSEWEADPRHVEITETLGLRHAEATAALMDEANIATDVSEDHASTHRSVCIRIHYLAQDRPDHLICSQGVGQVDVSATHHGVGNGKGMRSVLVGQTS